MKALLSILFLSLVMASTAFAQGLKCDMTQYKASTGLTAAVEQDLLVVTWAGQAGSEVRRGTPLRMASPWFVTWRSGNRVASGPHWVRILPRNTTS